MIQYYRWWLKDMIVSQLSGKQILVYNIVSDHSQEKQSS